MPRYYTGAFVMNKHRYNGAISGTMYLNKAAGNI